MSDSKKKTRPMIAVSVDDGACDTYSTVYPLLKKAGLPATFNIVTGYINRSGENGNGMTSAGKTVPLNPAMISQNAERGLFRLPMTLSQLEEMAANCLCELSSHSSDHSNRWESICKGADDLRDIIKAAKAERYYSRKESHGTKEEGDDGDESCLVGFASPGSQLTNADLLRMEKALRQQGVCYARTALRLKTCRLLRTLARKTSRVIHVGFLYALAYGDTLLDENDTFVLNSVPIMHDIRLGQVKAVVRLAERKERNCILLFHSITAKGGYMYDDAWSWDAGKFEGLLDFLKEEQAAGRIRVVKMRELVKTRLL